MIIYLFYLSTYLFVCCVLLFIFKFWSGERFKLTCNYYFALFIFIQYFLSNCLIFFSFHILVSQLSLFIYCHYSNGYCSNCRDCSVNAVAAGDVEKWRVKTESLGKYILTEVPEYRADMSQAAEGGPALGERCYSREGEIRSGSIA